MIPLAGAVFNPRKINRLPWNQYQMIMVRFANGRGMSLALDPKNRFVQRLIQEIGITEVQAHELISLLGYDWASLVREAKAIRDSFKPPENPSS